MLDFYKNEFLRLEEKLKKELNAQERIKDALAKGAKYYICDNVMFSHYPKTRGEIPFASYEEAEKYIESHDKWDSYADGGIGIYLYLNDVWLNIEEPDISSTKAEIKRISALVEAEEKIVADMANTPTVCNKNSQPVAGFEENFEKMKNLFKTKNNTTFTVDINKKCAIIRAFSANFALIKLPNGEIAGASEFAYSGENARHKLDEQKEIFVKRIKFNEKGKIEVCKWTL